MKKIDFKEKLIATLIILNTTTLILMTFFYIKLLDVENDLFWVDMEVKNIKSQSTSISNQIGSYNLSEEIQNATVIMQSVENKLDDFTFEYRLNRRQ